MKKRLTAMALAGTALFAQAQSIVPGELVIYEYLGANGTMGGFGSGRPYYVVANGTDKEIAAFGVTNNNFGDNGDQVRAGWASFAIGKNQWDDGESLAIISANFGLPAAVVNSGSFEHNFGTANAGVNFYWNTGGDAIMPGQVSEHFYFGGYWASEFMAWDTQGNTVYDDHHSAVHAVPEPATSAMMLSGLALVFGVARRRKASTDAKRQH